MDKLGMTDRNLREMKRIAEKPYGIILCVGPTGSGKTTTLHSVLGHINTPDIKIWTAEDPVEITQYGLRQVQVQPKIDFTFAAAMRSFLRADPDVIMVGEMRDEETAATGIEASLTGHLVLSTLHTNSSVETVIRLLDMGLDTFNFADALLGILAQRLVTPVSSQRYPSRLESRAGFFASTREECLSPRVRLECNPEIPVAPGEEHWLLDTSLDEVYWPCSHSRAIPSFPSQLEWKIGLAWANTRGSLNSPS